MYFLSMSPGTGVTFSLGACLRRCVKVSEKSAPKLDVLLQRE